MLQEGLGISPSENEKPFKQDRVSLGVCFRWENILESCKGMGLRMTPIGGRDPRVEDVAGDQGQAAEEPPGQE